MVVAKNRFENTAFIFNNYKTKSFKLKLLKLLLGVHSVASGARLELAHVVLIFVDWVLIVIICIDHYSIFVLVLFHLMLLFLPGSFF